MKIPDFSWGYRLSNCDVCLYIAVVELVPLGMTSENEDEYRR